MGGAARRADRRGRRPRRPALVAAAATGVRRGARVVVAAPYEGPLRDATAGHAALLAPRLGFPTNSGCAGIWPPGSRWCTPSTHGPAWTWRCSPTSSTPRRCATAPPASCSPIRRSCWPRASPTARSRWPATAPRRWPWPGTAARCCCGSRTRSPRPPGWRTRWSPCAPRPRPVSGRHRRSGRRPVPRRGDRRPLPPRLRVLAIILAAEQTVVAARTAGLDDVYLLAAEDVPDGPGGSAGSGVSPALGVPVASSSSWQY